MIGRRSINCSSVIEDSQDKKNPREGKHAGKGKTT